MSGDIGRSCVEEGPCGAGGLFLPRKNESDASTSAITNTWECISMPLNILEFSLKNHQVDAVVFFLKSQEDVSCGCRETPGKGESRDPDVSQLERIAALLSTSIKENVTNEVSRNFGDQLLHISLSHFNKVLQNAIKVKSRCSNESCIASRVADVAMKCIVDVRHHLLDFSKLVMPRAWPQSLDSEAVVEQLCRCKPELLKCWNSWNGKNEKDIICEAIRNRCLPLAESYCKMFLSSCDQNTSFHDRAVSVGLDWVIECFDNKNIELASSILFNIGCDISEKLHDICFNTANKVLRRFLVEELKRRDYLNDSELRMVGFLELVQQHFSCQSFNKACEFLSGSRSWTLNDLKCFENLFVQNYNGDVTDELNVTGNIEVCGVDNWEISDYCCLTLEWTKSWSSELWEYIIIEGFLGKEDSKLKDLISAKAVWQYLLKHNDLPRLLAWLNNSRLNCCSTDAEISGFSWPITPEMVEDVAKLASPYVANCVLNQLARSGTFCSAEAADVQLVMSRLVCTFSAGDLMSGVVSSPAMLGNMEFKKQVILLLLKNNLPYAVYEYFDRFGESCSEIFRENCEVKEKQDLSWFPMIVHFKNWAKDPASKDAVFKASLSNAEFILNLHKPTVEEIFKKGCGVLGLATVLCAQGTLQEALEPPQTVAESGWKVSAATLDSAFVQDPVLGPSLSKFVLMRNSPSQGITVYSLLQDCVPFDIRRLFGWQATNSCKASDCFADLPYFSHPELVKRYGHVQDLDFTYYLKQGRPTFAYVKFVLQCFECHGSVPSKEIPEACNRAHSMAILLNYDESIAAACVAFMEMLNWNTHGLRIDLQVARAILIHRKLTASHTSASSKLENLDCDDERNLATLVLNAVCGQKDAFESVLGSLEEAVMAKHSSDGPETSSMECAYSWSLAALFCRRHNFPLSTTFLRLCAEKNDWLLFTVFAEIHKFPKHQVMQVVAQYPSEQMSQHLRNAFGQLRYRTARVRSGKRWKFTSKKKLSRDIRANLYARIGVSTASANKQEKREQSEEKDSEIASDDDSVRSESAFGSSDDLTDHSAASSLMCYDGSYPLSPDDIPQDLLGIILQCGNTPCPWKSLLNCSVLLQNPVLTIMAACFQDASPTDCLCAWLLTSCCKDDYSDLLPLNEERLDYHVSYLTDLFNIIMSVMKLGQILTLVEGFYYFQPESPLYDLFRFLKLCMADKMYDASSSVLQDFHNSLSKKSDADKQVVGDRFWIEEVAVAAINEALQKTQSLRECVQFLDVLSAIQLSAVFTSAVSFPNYHQLMQVLQLLADVELQLSLQYLLLPSGDPRYSVECWKILDTLLSRKLFDVAYNYADIMELPKYSIVIAQMHEELLTQQGLLCNGNLQTRLTIWNRCSNMFRANRVPREMVAEFFMEYGLHVDHPWEKFYVLHLVWVEIRAEWPDVKLGQLDFEKVEREMWLARIKAEVRLVSGDVGADELIVEWDTYSGKALSPTPVKLMASREVFSRSQESLVQEPYTLHDASEKVALDRIIGKELDSGNMDTAFHLSQLFDHKCLSLNIVLTCLKLAEGSMALHHLDTEMRLLLERGSVSRPRKLSSRKFSLSSLRNSGSTSSFPGTPEAAPICAEAKTTSSALLTVPSAVSIKVQDDVLDVMEKLVNHCEFGGLCCSRIIVVHSIADILGLKFADIVQSFDDVAVLKALLQNDFEDRFFLAKEYVLANDVDDVFIASFLCEHIVSALRLFTGFTKDEEQQLSSSRELILKPTDSTATFVQLVKLCKNPSILGSHLIELMGLRRKNEIELTLEVELCVRAHTCFTVACHVEGITRSLQKAKRLCKLLTEASEFSLMVRLLTGIGRFSEMTYIFDILRENHQFELLFRKGMEKVPDLKMALLDYVRRFHSVDGETFTMISLHFSMYREIADVLNADAKDQMKLLNFDNMQEQPNLQESLENIMQLFADAAESYSKAECIQQAMFCAKQAELVALQLYLKNAGIQILGLEPQKVSEFIAKHNKVYESAIIAEAYGRHQDWALALYTNFVVRNDSNYLKDFQEIMAVSSCLVEEVVRRYQKNSEKTNRMTANLKHMLNMLDDIQIKYNLAADLGFEDITGEMLCGDGSSYLKDLIDSRCQW